MNIIFLDFYGVLNSNEFIEKNKDKLLDFNLRNNFRRILNDTNSKVILLASWHNLIDIKNNKESEFRKIYKEFGFDKGTYLDYTPIFDGNEKEGIKFNILKYATSRHKTIIPYNVEKIAIISSNILTDLELNVFMNIPVKYFKTDMNYGLTADLSNNIINFLNEVK